LVVPRRALIAVIVAAVVTVAAAGFAFGRAMASNPSSTATAAGGTKGRAGAPVEIKGFAFTPPTVTIKPGGSVTWTNGDPFDHSIKSANGAFNSEDLPQGQTFTATFPTPGTYAYICGIHNNMKGTVVVQG
jgi:plastocyanin